MFYVVLAAVFIVFCYFTVRYFLLLYSLKEINKELMESCEDLTQNQMLHLPVPGREAKALINTINGLLSGILRERQSYEKRERQFQQEIENISHDLRTPLTVILGYLKLIKEYGPENGKDFKAFLEIIGRKAETMEKLVTQFYDFSRLNAPGMRLLVQQVDAGRCLRECLAGNYELLQKSGLTVDINIPGKPLWAVGEIMALERIFYNLIQNAGRYAGKYLEISAVSEEGDIVIRFVNDAPDLSLEDMEHLFDRFYTQDPSRSKGGTGLGLTVARLLAKKMGASLTAGFSSGLSGRSGSRSAKTDNAIDKGTEDNNSTCSKALMIELRLKGCFGTCEGK